jgi:DNA-binding transcriptional MocR family regulator
MPILEDDYGASAPRAELGAADARLGDRVIYVGTFSTLSPARLGCEVGAPRCSRRSRSARGPASGVAVDQMAVAGSRGDALGVTSAASGSAAPSGSRGSRR